MGRVDKEKALAASVSTSRLKQERKKAQYRVVLEEVTQKRKLRTYVSFNAAPPRGYTFIPAGDPQLTKRCKRISKQLGQIVYIVSTGAHASLELSKEVHRIGYHFSSFVVDKACQSLGVTLNAAGRVTQSHFAFLNEDELQDAIRLRQSRGRKTKFKPARDGLKLDTSLSQAVIDSQAREAIQDLFPKIPGRDLHEIIVRAFDKKKGLVGTAQGTSLVRRANLAVVAHIRHMYTNYDELLRSGMTWMEARRGVEQFTLDKLVSWRGEEDDDDDVMMEDVLREVVVISDDEDEHEQSKELMNAKMPSSTNLGHDMSAPLAVDLISDDEDEDEDEESGDEAMVEYRRSSHPVQGTFVSQSKTALEARMEEQRHTRWEQAVQRHKHKPPVLPRQPDKGRPGVIFTEQPIGSSSSTEFRIPGLLYDSKPPAAKNTSHNFQKDNFAPRNQPLGNESEQTDQGFSRIALYSKSEGESSQMPDADVILPSIENEMHYTHPFLKDSSGQTATVPKQSDHAHTVSHSAVKHDDWIRRDDAPLEPTALQSSETSHKRDFHPMSAVKTVLIPLDGDRGAMSVEKPPNYSRVSNPSSLRALMPDPQKASSSHMLGLSQDRRPGPLHAFDTVRVPTEQHDLVSQPAPRGPFLLKNEQAQGSRAWEGKNSVSSRVPKQIPFDSSIDAGSHRRVLYPILPDDLQSDERSGHPSDQGTNPAQRPQWLQNSVQEPLSHKPHHDLPSQAYYRITNQVASDRVRQTSQALPHVRYIAQENLDYPSDPPLRHYEAPTRRLYSNLKKGTSVPMPGGAVTTSDLGQQVPGSRDRHPPDIIILD